MSMAARTLALATAIGNHIRDSVLTRLLPAGGTINQILAKTSATDFAVGWVTPGGGSDPWTWLKLAGDVSNSTVTPAAATGLSFAAVANTTYLVEAIGALQSAATTTGAALALDIPSGSVIGQAIFSTSASALGAVEQIADNTTTGATTGVRAAATNTPFRAAWIVAVGATGGTVQLQFRSEIAASAVTLKANLTVFGRRILP